MGTLYWYADTTITTPYLILPYLIQELYVIVYEFLWFSICWRNNDIVVNLSLHRWVTGPRHAALSVSLLAAPCWSWSGHSGHSVPAVQVATGQAGTTTNTSSTDSNCWIQGLQSVTVSSTWHILRVAVVEVVSRLLPVYGLVFSRAWMILLHWCLRTNTHNARNTVRLVSDQVRLVLRLR